MTAFVWPAAHREGTCTYEDGAVYTGEWNQDQRSGWGRHTFSNKDWYEGEWEADTMEGQGRLTLTDKSYYECSWHLGQPQKGKWYSADGKTEYDGQFKGMLWHGFGTVHQTGVRKYMGKTMRLCSHAASLHCSHALLPCTTAMSSKAANSHRCTWISQQQQCSHESLMQCLQRLIYSSKACIPGVSRQVIMAAQLGRHAVHVAVLCEF